MNTPRPTPETDAFAKAMYKRGVNCHHDGREAQKTAERLERERNEAREHLAAANKGAEINAHINHSLAAKLAEAKRELNEAREQLEAMERAGAEQARRADENREWALGTERERNEVIDQLEAMRKAIKEVALQLTFAEKVSGASVLHIYVYDALTKLQPFIKP